MCICLAEGSLGQVTTKTDTNKKKRVLLDPGGVIKPEKVFARDDFGEIVKVYLEI